MSGIRAKGLASWMVAAWITEALSLVGVTNAVVTDTRYEPGSQDQSAFRWEVSWPD